MEKVRNRAQRWQVFLVLFLFFLSVSALGLNINSATVEELASLPGVGPVLARRIVEYRSRHGPFRQPEDLLKIKGIGPARLARLKPYLEFGLSSSNSPKKISREDSAGGYIYRWVDDRGVVHFTEFPEDIPPRFRSRAQKIPLPVGPEEKSAGGAETGPVSPSSPGFEEPKTDIRGRDLSWYRKEKVRLKNEIARLRAQIEENRQAMRLLHGGSYIARRGVRTKYGIKLGKGPLLRRWAEYKRLRRINQELEKKLSKLEYRLEKGLYREALLAHAPDEVLEFLRKDP